MNPGSKASFLTDSALTDSAALAAELAELGESALDADEAAWLAAQSTREDTAVGALRESMPASDLQVPVAAELSQHSLQRVWGRIERRWWHHRLHHHAKSLWTALHQTMAFVVSPRRLAFAAATLVVVIVGVQNSDRLASKTDTSTNDDDLAALGAIVHAQLHDLQMNESTSDARIASRSPSALPPMRWTQAIATPHPSVRNDRQP